VDEGEPPDCLTGRGQYKAILLKNVYSPEQVDHPRLSDKVVDFGHLV